MELDIAWLCKTSSYSLFTFHLWNCGLCLPPENYQKANATNRNCVLVMPRTKGTSRWKEFYRSWRPSELLVEQLPTDLAESFAAEQSHGDIEGNHASNGTALTKMWRCIKTPYKFKYPQNCYRFFFLLSFLWVLELSTYWKVYIKKICLLKLRQEDLPLKLRHEDLPSRASSRRFGF